MIQIEGAGVRRVQASSCAANCPSSDIIGMQTHVQSLLIAAC
jgi:hypothetical protein